MAVGAPTVIRAWRGQPAAAIAFVAAFYLLLVGSKIGVAVILGQARNRFAHRLPLIVRISSSLLVIAGVYMLYSAWQNLSAP